MMYCEFIDISEYGENYISLHRVFTIILSLFTGCRLIQTGLCGITEGDYTPDG